MQNRLKHRTSNDFQYLIIWTNYPLEIVFFKCNMRSGPLQVADGIQKFWFENQFDSNLRNNRLRGKTFAAKEWIAIPVHNKVISKKI